MTGQLRCTLLKTVVFTAILTGVWSPLHAQPYFFNAWMYNYGTITDNNMVPTRDGGYIITSYTIPQDDTLYHLPYCVVTRVDSIGNSVWSKQWILSDFDFNVYDNNAVCQTTDGGFAIASTFISGISGSPPVFQSVSVYVVKLDSLGNLLWSRTYPTGDITLARDIDATPDGGLIIAGSRTNNNNDASAYLLKTDSLGNYEWGKRFSYGGYGDRLSQVRPTSDGGYIVTGSAGAPLQSFVMKTDSAGNPVWSYATQGIIMEGDVRELPGGGFVTMGTHYLGNYTYPILTRYDAGGIPLWRNTYQRYSSSSYDVGFAVTPVEDDGFTMAIGLHDSTTNYGMILLHTDSLGQPIWSRQILECGRLACELYRENNSYAFSTTHAENNPMRWGPAIVRTNDLGANCLSYLVADSAYPRPLPVPIGITAVPDTGIQQSYATEVWTTIIPAFYVCPSLTSVPDDHSSEQSLVLNGNPVSDQLNFTIRGRPGKVEVIVVDVLGQTMCMGTENIASESANCSVNTSMQAAGMYFLLVQYPSGEVLKQPFIVQH